MIADLIAHYRVTAKLGEGGMGEVWRAIDTKLNREVAIKILPESFANDIRRSACWRNSEPAGYPRRYFWLAAPKPPTVQPLQIPNPLPLL